MTFSVPATAHACMRSEGVRAITPPICSHSQDLADTINAEVRRSFITTTVREQRPRPHHKGATVRV